MSLGRFHCPHTKVHLMKSIASVETAQSPLLMLSTLTEFILIREMICCISWGCFDEGSAQSLSVPQNQALCSTSSLKRRDPFFSAEIVFPTCFICLENSAFLLFLLNVSYVYYALLLCTPIPVSYSLFCSHLLASSLQILFLGARSCFSFSFT